MSLAPQLGAGMGRCRAASGEEASMVTIGGSGDAAAVRSRKRLRELNNRVVVEEVERREKKEA